MYGLEGITRDEVAEVLNDRSTAEIEIPATIAGFKDDLPKVDFSQPVEVPPSPASINAEILGQSLVFGGNDLDGKYLRLVLFVYSLGGKIHYTELPSGSYKASITWLPAA